MNPINAAPDLNDLVALKAAINDNGNRVRTLEKQVSK